MNKLGKIWKWIKKHWYVPSFFIFLVLIILPVLYKSLLNVAISSDWLGYYGTCLATCGTVFLGAVALWQNKIIYESGKEAAAKEMEQEQRKEQKKFEKRKEAIRPVLTVENIFTSSTQTVVVDIINRNKNAAYNIHVKDASMKNLTNDGIIFAPTLEGIVPVLLVNKSAQLIFVDKVFLFDYKIIFTICFDEVKS